MKNVTLFLGSFALAVNSFAASYTTTQITNNTYADEYTKINAPGDVIWTAWVNATDTGWTVFKYDAATQATTQLSVSNASFNSHRINSRGDVVWMGSDGTDQEIFLYQAASKSLVQVTSNTLDDTAPEISDNGDVAWFEQRGVDVGAVLYRYDALNQIVVSVDFPGATRQGMHTMNARGDIAWNAEVSVPEVQNGAIVPVTYNQEILVFTAATRTVRNLTQSQSVLDTNQRLLDNGDIVWSTYDLPTGAQAIKRYHAADGSVTEIMAGPIEGAYLVGTQGHVAWVTGVPAGVDTLYTLFLYDPVTGGVSTISAEVLARFPFVDGVSSRGDVLWRTHGATLYTKHYNAATKAIVNLTVMLSSQGSGPFDLVLADNGDAAWSLWDGTDFEVYSYQVATVSTTQLTNNSVDDGLASMNASGSIVWNRFYPSNNSEVVLAVKSTAAPMLTIKVTAAKFIARGSEAQLKANFVIGTMPSATDIIGVRFDSATLLDAAFSNFKAAGAGIFKYSGRKISAKLDFNKGTIEITKGNVNPALVNTRDGVDVEIRIGADSAVDHFKK